MLPKTCFLVSGLVCKHANYRLLTTNTQVFTKPYLCYNTGLIAQLWEESFTPAQLRGGFRACGIFPVNRHAIPASKLAISIPYSSQSGSAAAANTTSESTQTTCQNTTATSSAVMHLKCSDCGRSITPIRMHVAAFFTQHLQGVAQKGKKDTRRLKPRYYGEVLTRDERMEKDKAEKQKKKGRGKKMGECQPSIPNHGKDTFQSITASCVIQCPTHADEDEESCQGCGAGMMRLGEKKLDWM